MVQKVILELKEKWDIKGLMGRVDKKATRLWLMSTKFYNVSLGDKGDLGDRGPRGWLQRLSYVHVTIYIIIA